MHGMRWGALARNALGGPGSRREWTYAVVASRDHVGERPAQGGINNAPMVARLCLPLALALYLGVLCPAILLAGRRFVKNAQAVGAVHCTPWIPLKYQLVNRSLGLQYIHSGKQDCSQVGQRGSATFRYTPNRPRGLGRDWHNATAASIVIDGFGKQAVAFSMSPDPWLRPITGVVVARIHKFKPEDMVRYIGLLANSWNTWDDNLFTPNNADLAMMVVLTSYGPDWDRKSLQAVVRRLNIIHCGDFNVTDIHGVSHPHHAYKTKNHSGLVLVTFQEVLGGMGIVDQYNKTTALYPPDYIYGTNWYGFGMVRLPIMDFFDIWYKVDLDMLFPKGWMPNLGSFLKYNTADQGVFVFIQWLADAPYQLIGVHEWEASVFAEASEHCFGEWKASNFRCRDVKKCREVHMVNYAEFTGGTLDFWQSPEMVRLGHTYEKFPNGMWKHRWGDQQFWIPAMAIFFTPQEFDKLGIEINDFWLTKTMRPR